MLKSSIGRKFVMAVTGLGLFGFVVAHMLGNLQLFLGPAALNNYAHKLEELGALLWVARIGLLVIFVAHVMIAFQLSQENREARPVAYSFESTVKASFASRTMLYSGLLILAFLIYHLAHFTFRIIYFEALPMVDLDGHKVRDVYHMVVLGFQNWLISGLYIFAQLVLGVHLSHGASSMFQTLGINHPKLNPVISKIGPVSAAIIVVGNVSMPLAVLAGIVK